MSRTQHGCECNPSGPLREGMTRRTMIVGLTSSVLLVSGSGVSVAGCSLQRADSGPRIAVAYVPYWDQQRGFAVVRRYIDLFDQVSPMWYSLDDGGNVVPADDQYVAVDLDEVRFLQTGGIKILPTLVDLRNGTWAPNLVRAVLRNPSARARHIDAVVELVESNRYDGVDIDYEQLQGDDRELYSAFIHDLAAPLHVRGKLLSVTVYPKQTEPGPYEHNAAQDYRGIGFACDQVRVMTYDFHYSSSLPGPVAPAEWVEKCIAWAVTVVPPSKVMLGVVLLGYDWTRGAEGQPVTHEDVMARVRKYTAAVRRDADNSPSFEYTDDQGLQHTVWFEDAQSTQAKLQLVDRYGLAGAFFWRLGDEDPNTWKLPTLAP